MKYSAGKSLSRPTRILISVFYGIILLAAIAILVLAAREEKQDFSFWFKGGVVTVTLTAAFIGSLTGTSAQKSLGSKRHLYHERFGDFIGRAFDTDRKAEKQLIKAIDLYATDKPADAMSILKKLYAQCQIQEDRCAVVTFMGLCLHDLNIYGQAAEMYAFSLRMRPHSTIASNLGLCYERIGDYEQAIESYTQAIHINPQNAFAHNNLAVLRIRQGNYEEALHSAEQAVKINQRMPQALNSMAVCHYMLGNIDEYQKYYRQAVSSGSDGKKLKSYIASLDSTITK